MSNNMTISEDDFAVSMFGILEGVQNDIDDGLDKCVRKACSKARNVTKKNSPVGKDTHTMPQYKDGWTYSVSKKKSGTVGEVGNKTKPGLAHLLELGHARIGGGRVKPRVHIKTGAQEGASVLEQECNELVERALK